MACSYSPATSAKARFSSRRPCGLRGEKDAKGHRRLDPAELQRVYQRTPSPYSQVVEHDSQKIITVLENRVADLQKQLELANTREESLTAEKSKLLDIVDRIQKQNAVLMIPAEKQKSGFFTLLREKFLA